MASVKTKGKRVAERLLKQLKASNAMLTKTHKGWGICSNPKTCQEAKLIRANNELIAALTSSASQ